MTTSDQIRNQCMNQELRDRAQRLLETATDWRGTLILIRGSWEFSIRQAKGSAEMALQVSPSDLSYEDHCTLELVGWLSQGLIVGKNGFKMSTNSREEEIITGIATFFKLTD